MADFLYLFVRVEEDELGTVQVSKQFLLDLHPLEHLHAQPKTPNEKHSGPTVPFGPMHTLYILSSNQLHLLNSQTTTAH
jgi:hypothetical protein